MIYTILDIETTGLDKYGGDEILSAGYMRINSQFEIKASGTLYFYKPEFNVGKYPACTVHKLTRSFLSQYEGDFYDNIKKLYSLCYMSTIIGKNSTKFDMPFVKEFIHRHCNTLPPLEYFRTFDIQDHFKPIYQERTGSRKTGTLTEYCECLGIGKEKLDSIYNSLPNKDGSSMHMHGALYDVVATYAVFKEVCRIKNIQT